MPHAPSAGARLYYEEVGSGHPLLFVHEFAGDHRSWEAQLRFFARRYRCIAYNARGYPPSDVPDDVESYRQEQQADEPWNAPVGDKAEAPDVLRYRLGLVGTKRRVDRSRVCRCQTEGEGNGRRYYIGCPTSARRSGTPPPECCRCPDGRR
jgi:hypothetical protein